MSDFYLDDTTSIICNRCHRLEEYPLGDEVCCPMCNTKYMLCTPCYNWACQHEAEGLLLCSRRCRDIKDMTPDGDEDEDS